MCQCKGIECIGFADDMVLLAESEIMANKMLEKLNEAYEEYGIWINTSKTKCMAISKGRKHTKIKIGQVNITKVPLYLWSIVTEELRSHQEE